MSALELVFAAEYLLPPPGGAERFVLELLEKLAAGGHGVRAIWLGGPETPPAGVEGLPAPEPASSDGYWHTKRLRREAITHAVSEALADRPADVVLTQLHAAPGAVTAARAAGAATLVLLPSYEALCKYAFDLDADCAEGHDCRSCPAVARLQPEERMELLASRAAHAGALAEASALVAPSAALAAVAEEWCGRQPAVVPPVVSPPPHANAGPEGAVVAIARWSLNKGVKLLEPLARGLPHRHLRILRNNLPDSLEQTLGALPNVELVPPAPVTRLLDGAALTLVPSQTEEPFSRVAFESLAAGVPALASDAGGLREYVPPSLLVRPRDDIAAWLGAVQELEDPSRWRRARAAGLRAADSVLHEHPPATVERLLLRIAAMRARAPRTRPLRSP